MINLIIEIIIDLYLDELCSLLNDYNIIPKYKVNKLLLFASGVGNIDKDNKLQLKLDEFKIIVGWNN